MWPKMLWMNYILRMDRKNTFELIDVLSTWTSDRLCGYILMLYTYQDLKATAWINRNDNS